MRSFFLLPLVILFFTTERTESGEFRVSDDAKHALQTVTQSSLLSHIRFLSNDLLEGRAPGTRGDVLARLYIASQMELIGLQPGAEDGSYFQSVPILSMTTDPSMTLDIRGKERSLSLTYRKDFVGVAGLQKPVVTIDDAETMFVGYGIVAPEQGWDDYKGLDVRGKTLHCAGWGKKFSSD